MAHVAIGIDLGGTFIKAGLVSETGEVLQRYTKPTEAHEGRATVVKNIGDLIEEVIESEAMQGRKDDLEGIGIGSPGLINHEEGSIRRPVNIPGWDEWVCVREIYNSRFSQYNVNTWVDNDANVAALAEAMFGAGKGKKVVLLLTLGTGVGGGIVMGNKVYHGAAGFGGELGHMMVNPSGPVCGCGNEGCLETYASANGIAHYAQGRAKVDHIPTILKKMCDEAWQEEWKEIRSEIEKVSEKTGDALDEQLSELQDRLQKHKWSLISSKMVYEAALKGDEVALDVVEHAGRHLGIGLATLIVCFNPDIICIGGGGGEMGEMLFKHARKEIAKRVFFHNLYPYDERIVQAKFKNDAGIVGAACLVFENA